MRISQRQQLATAIRYLHQNQATVEELRNQLGTQKRILQPDDDPQGTQQAINLRTSLNAVENSLRNLDVSEGWMDATASSLGELGNLLAKARVEAERGANETLSYEIRQTITAEIHEYFQQAVNIGNTEHLGRQIFAGYRVDQQPFVADLVTHTVTYQGDAGQIQHELEPGVKTTVNVAGSNPVFDASFDALRALHDALVAGDTNAIRDSIDLLDDGIDLCLQQQSNMGARMKVATSVRSRLQQFEVDLQGLLSKVEDIDLPEAILNLSTNEQSYEAMLSAASRIMPRTLFDYLR
jgi:flagellar hook-associated protein 3 FlgL